MHMQGGGGQDGVEGIQNALIFVAVADMFKHRAADPLPAQFTPQQCRQKAAEPVGFDRDRRQDEVANEHRHLSAKLGGFVDLVALLWIMLEIGDSVQPVLTLIVSKYRRHDTGVAGRWRTKGWIPPTIGRHQAARTEREDALAIALPIGEFEVVAAEPPRIQANILVLAWCQQHLARELGRPALLPHGGDRGIGETIRPTAAACVIQDGDRQAPKARQERARQIRLCGSLLGVDRLVAVRRADIEL